MNQDTPHQAFALPIPTAHLRQAHDHPHHNVSDMFGSFRRHRVGLIAWVALCLGVAFTYLLLATPEYVASALVILEPHHADTREADTENPRLVTLDAAQADSQIQVIKSERLMRLVFDTLHLAQTAEFSTHTPSVIERVMSLFHRNSDSTQTDDIDSALMRFMNAVSVRRIGQSYVLEISYTAPRADIAASRANSIAAAYIWDQTEIKAASAAHGTEFLQTRITDIAAETAAALEAVQIGKIPAIRFPDSDARVIGAAIEPKHKAFPQSTLVLAFAGVVGLLTGLGYSTARHSLDHTLRSRYQVQRGLGIDCLTTVPRVPAGEQATLLDLRRSCWRHQGPFRDALRSVRTAVMVSNRNLRHRSIGVMSWHAGEGKSTISAHLAHVIAASGERVALLDCDFRNATLTAALASDAPRGLNELLLNQDLDIRPIHVPLFGKLDFFPAASAERYRDPDVYLGSPQMRNLLADLQVDSSVVVDLPAMSLSSDAQAIAPLLDGVILVVEACRTTIEEVTCAVSALSGTGNLIGIVLNKERVKHL